MEIVKANIGFAAVIATPPVSAAAMVISGKVPDVGDGGFLVFGVAPTG